jgi:hypothetical protein
MPAFESWRFVKEVWIVTVISNPSPLLNLAIVNHLLA